MKIIVTGGLGFIGSALIRKIMQDPQTHVLNIDKITYAAHPDALEAQAGLPNYHFLKADISETDVIRDAIIKFQPDHILHLAAESHVDRSIANASEFLKTNVIGTYSMLEASLAYWKDLPSEKKEKFRFVHVSTDEVYGDLHKEDPAFTEETAYAPNSPYSASKAASDHFARAWNKTFKLPVIITHCSNNYGPWQNDEKLIPTIIRSALAEKPIPVYGTGTNVRDWIYVQDHADALLQIAEKGSVGEVYNIGGESEFENIAIVKMICAILDKQKPRSNGKSYAELIEFVTDRLGHDFRYAINNEKINRDLAWVPATPFAKGLNETIAWYTQKYEGK